MNKNEIKELIKQVISDMINSDDIEEVNVTSDVGGFDAPFGAKPVKRKLKDCLIDKEDEDN